MAITRARLWAGRAGGLAVAAVTGLLVLTGVVGTEGSADASARTPRHAVGATTHQAGPRLRHGEPVPVVPAAPRTAAGYAAMFARVPVSQWGGADVSISTRLPDGRRVWLFGDTLSARPDGFVHSSAIVQDGGTLHVSRRGAQVVPDVSSPTRGYRRVYWVETVRTVGADLVRVQLAPTEVGTKGVWDFHRWDRRSMEADLRVDDRGDVTFSRWVGWSRPADVGGDGEDFRVLGPHHFTYQEFVHDIRLSDGRYLKTVNQNWDDDWKYHHNQDGSFRFTDWRPLFRESATRTSPYWGH